MYYKKLKISMNPYQLYSLLKSEYGMTFLLESLEGKERLARFSFLGFDPKSTVVAQGSRVELDGKELDTKGASPLRALANCMPRVLVEKEGFVGGAVGYVSYDYVRNVEKLPEGDKQKSEFPDFEFGIFHDCIVYDHRDRSVHYISHDEDRSELVLTLAKKEVRLGTFKAGKPKENMGREQFVQAVQKAHSHIVDGDIFQVVISRRYEMDFEGDMVSFYNYLKQTNPSPYMYFLSFGKRNIIGSSPENLIRVEGNKIDSYATVAGTAKRGATAEEDVKLEQALLNDEKEKAEHLMLVDLTRNDLSKIAKFNTVQVPEFMEIHKYRHVQHIASHVVAQMQEGKDCFDAFEAIFPAGTLTGAPKVRAMEIIEKLEPTRRGTYGGAVGYFSFNGNCDFAINIRAIATSGNKAYLQAGAGIVYDSIPEKEFEETENKMRSLLVALGVEQ